MKIFAILSVLASCVLADGPAGHHGHHTGVHHAPVHHGSFVQHAPVHHAQVHHAPVHHVPVHQVPVHHSPVFHQAPLVKQAPAPPAGNIAELVVASPEFSTLLAAVKAAGLVDTLAGEGPFTVFAPTNGAFEKIPQETLQGLLADKDALTAVLLRHVVPGAALQVNGLKKSNDPRKFPKNFLKFVLIEMSSDPP